MKETIREHLAIHGYHGRLVSIGRLQELEEEIHLSYERGLLDDGLYQTYLSKFDRLPPGEMPDARSLIVVAYADPPVRFAFSWKGRTAHLAVPPTYLNAQAKDAAVGRLLAELLTPEGYHVAQALAPKKLLAVHSGLARYGKNNITYVEGLGSYHRLVVFCSDYPCVGERWMEVRMLENCRRCQACRRGCPSGAITADRFLLHAERCLTFWNEKPKTTAFPDWVEDSWHNCLVGCLECQRVCPENSMHIDHYEEGAGFSERETALILAGEDPSKLPAALIEKMRRWDLLELYDQLPRNLKAFLERAS